MSKKIKNLILKLDDYKDYCYFKNEYFSIINKTPLLTNPNDTKKNHKSSLKNKESQNNQLTLLDRSKKLEMSDNKSKIHSQKLSQRREMEQKTPHIQINHFDQVNEITKFEEIFNENSDVKTFMREKNRILQLAKIIQKKDEIFDATVNGKVIYNKFTNMKLCLEKLIKRNYSNFLNKLKNSKIALMSEHLTVDEFLFNKKKLLEKQAITEAFKKAKEKKYLREKIKRLAQKNTDNKHSKKRSSISISKSLCKSIHKLKALKQLSVELPKFNKKISEDSLIITNERNIEDKNNVSESFGDKNFESEHLVQKEQNSPPRNKKSYVTDSIYAKNNSKLNYNFGKTRLSYSNHLKDKDFFITKHNLVYDNKYDSNCDSTFDINNENKFDGLINKFKNLLDSNNRKTQTHLNVISENSNNQSQINAKQQIDVPKSSKIRIDQNSNNHKEQNQRYNHDKKHDINKNLGSNQTNGSNLLIQSCKYFPHRFKLIDSVNSEFTDQSNPKKITSTIKFTTIMKSKTTNSKGDNLNNRILQTIHDDNKEKENQNSSNLKNYFKSSLRESNLLAQNEKEYNKVIDQLNIDYSTYLRTLTKEHCKLKFPTIISELEKSADTYWKYFQLRTDRLEDLKVSKMQFYKSMKRKLYKVKKIREHLERIQNLNDEYLLNDEKVYFSTKEKYNSSNKVKYTITSTSSNIH